MGTHVKICVLLVEAPMIQKIISAPQDHPTAQDSTWQPPALVHRCLGMGSTSGSHGKKNIHEIFLRLLFDWNHSFQFNQFFHSLQPRALNWKAFLRHTKNILGKGPGFSSEAARCVHAWKKIMCGRWHACRYGSHKNLKYIAYPNSKSAYIYIYYNVVKLL